MENEYLVSIGYSIGILPYEEGRVGVIDRGDESIILEPKSFLAWKIIFDCINYNEFRKKYNDIVSADDINEILAELIKNDIVLKLSGYVDLEEYYEVFKDFKLHRQGIGLGIDRNDISKYRVITDIENILEPIEFTVWSSANIGLKIEEIYESVKEYIDKATLILILLRLYRINLIYFMR